MKVLLLTLLLLVVVAFSLAVASSRRRSTPPVEEEKGFEITKTKPRILALRGNLGTLNGGDRLIPVQSAGEVFVQEFIKEGGFLIRHANSDRYLSASEDEDVVLAKQLPNSKDPLFVWTVQGNSIKIKDKDLFMSPSPPARVVFLTRKGEATSGNFLVSQRILATADKFAVFDKGTLKATSAFNRAIPFFPIPFPNDRYRILFDTPKGFIELGVEDGKFVFGRRMSWRIDNNVPVSEGNFVPVLQGDKIVPKRTNGEGFPEGTLAFEKKYIIQVQVDNKLRFLEVKGSSQGYKKDTGDSTVFRKVDEKNTDTNQVCGVPKNITTFRLQAEDGKYLGLKSGLQDNGKAYVAEDADSDRWTTDVFEDFLINADGIDRANEDLQPGLFPETKTDGVYFVQNNSCGQAINTAKLVET